MSCPVDNINGKIYPRPLEHCKAELISVEISLIWATAGGVASILTLRVHLSRARQATEHQLHIAIYCSQQMGVMLAIYCYIAILLYIQY